MALAASLRKVSNGLNEIMALLEGNVPGVDRDKRRLSVLRRFDVPADKGLSREEASQVFVENGYNPRSFGGWVRRGLITGQKEGSRYLTDKGRKLLAALDAKIAAG